MNQTIRILIEVTAYSIVLFAALMLFKRVFRRSISPAMGYAIWALLLLRLMIPVTIESDLRVFVIPDTVAQLPQAQIVRDDHSLPIEIAQTSSAASDLDETEAAPVRDELPVTRRDDSQTSSETTATNVSAIQGQTIDWQTALVILWAAGAVCFGVYMLWLCLRIRRYTISKGIPASEDILRLVDACKRDMGIKADIEVRIQYWLNTPALTASLKPKLLLPHSMLLCMDEKQIEFGIRHELMHYRHRDYLMVLLLLLRCVYWFNPVVWLASRQIETDMEAACDVGVTASLNHMERVDYAQTMIDLGSNANAYMLGMGLSSSRMSMEKRVRSLFMEKRTRPSVKLAAAVLSGLLIFACFTTACQPIQAESVDNAAVIDTPVETAEATPTPAPTAEPEVNPNEGYGDFPDWVETYTSPYIEADINAQTVTPDTDVFPVYKVKKRTLDDGTIQKIVDYFAGDAVGVREFSYTEEELQEQLKSAKKYDADDKDYIKELKQQIASVQPEVFEPITQNASLTGQHIYLKSDDKRTYVSFSHGNDDVDRFSIYNYSNNYGIQPESWIRDSGPARQVKPMDKALDAVKMTEQEASTKAMAAMAAWGIENMAVSNVQKAIVVNGYVDDVFSGGWLVTITRSDDGSIPIDYYFSVSKGGLLSFSKEDYFERWSDEWIDIYIDDNGIQSMGWRDPIEVTEVVEDNAALMPYEDAKQAIKDAMALGISNMIEKQKEYAAESEVEIEVDTTDTHIVVDKIVLTNVLVPQGDDLDYQLMFPAWLVYYKEVWEFEGKKGEGMLTVFAVNATDGSVIDLRHRSHEADQRAEERRQQQKEEEAES